MKPRNLKYRTKLSARKKIAEYAQGNRKYRFESLKMPISRRLFYLQPILGTCLKVKIKAGRLQSIWSDCSKLVLGP